MVGQSNASDMRLRAVSSICAWTPPWWVKRKHRKRAREKERVRRGREEAMGRESEVWRVKKKL